MRKKHAFITGASTGLGRELAKQFAKRGYDLTLIARRKKPLADLKKELRDAEQKILTIAADVSDWDAIQAAVAKAEVDIGTIDLLIANAGIAYPTPASRFQPERAREILEVNVLGLMHSIAAVTPGFIERKSGQIVGISSLSSYVSLPGYSVYSASKAAVSSYLEGVRVELAPYKIGVSTVCPGFIKTPMTEGSKFKMPFLMEVDEAAEFIATRIEKRVEWINLPEPLFRAIQGLNLLPNPLRKAILGRGLASMT